MEIVIFLLAVYGATDIICEGEIFRTLRNWLVDKSRTNKAAEFFGKIVFCYQCCSFWVSFAFCGVFFLCPFILLPFAGCGFVTALKKVYERA